MQITPIQPSPPSLTSLMADPARTFADALTLVAGWSELAESRRRDMASALRSASRMLALPPAAIPCDTTWLNERLFQSAPAAFGIGTGRFRNIVSELRAILRRLGQHAPEHHGLSGLTQPWQHLVSAVAHPARRAALSAFGRFCVGRNAEPQEVDDTLLADFATTDAATRLSGGAPRRAHVIAQAWNAGVRGRLPGWPGQTLRAAPRRERYTLPFSAFPESFQQDIAAFRDRLTGKDGRFIMSETAGRRLRPATVEARLFALRQAAGILVRSGIGPEEIKRLSDLVDPVSRVATVLDMLAEAQAQRSGDRNPSGGQLAMVAETLRQVAVYHVSTDTEVVRKISQWTRQARGKRGEGLTTKNRDRLRKLIQLPARAMLLHLPQELMRRARKIGPDDPGAARLALAAVAIEILLVCPLRRRSLLALRLDEHLQRLDPRRRRITHLVLQGEDTKTNMPLEWPVPPETATMMETYIRDFRPTLAPPDSMWLFPGPKGALSTTGLTARVTRVIEQETGAKVHVHLLRHFAAWLYLKANPGAYEDVRRALGHSSLETTVQFYIAFEAAAAAERFDATVLRERQATRNVVTARWGKLPVKARSPRRAS